MDVPEDIFFEAAAGATGSARFFELLREMWFMHRRKAADYANDADPLANLTRTGEFTGLRPSFVSLVRIGEKLARLRQLVRSEYGPCDRKVENETFDDTLLDLAAYCLICIELRERESGPAPEPMELEKTKIEEGPAHGPMTTKG